MAYLIYSIEDDKDISHLINLILTKQGYEVSSFYDAKSFFEAFETKKPDMILLDLMLPDSSGEDILKRIRSNPINKDIEVIVVSAKNSLLSTVDLLDLGADDYISKPFEVLELISRVNARKRRHEKDSLIIYKDLVINPLKFEILRNNEKISLTSNEFKIFLYLLKNKEKIVSRDELFKSYWGVETSYESRAIDVHIKSIRKKLSKDEGDDQYITTVYGEGYKLENE